MNARLGGVFGVCDLVVWIDRMERGRLRLLMDGENHLISILSIGLDQSASDGVYVMILMIL